MQRKQLAERVDGKVDATLAEADQFAQVCDDRLEDAGGGFVGWHAE